jgi:hypothetical protein
VIALAGVALTLSLNGCFLLGPPVRNPSVVGVIEAEENMDGAWRYELSGGDTLEIDFDNTVTLPESTGGGVGALLLYGGGEDSWYMTLREPHADSYGFLLDAEARDDGEHIVFENGLRLSKAPDFDGRGWPQDGRYDSPSGEAGFAPFCINGDGEVTVYLAQPADRREGCPED